MGQREGTQGHCSRAYRLLKLALNFLFLLPVLECVLGMPPLGSLPVGRRLQRHSSAMLMLYMTAAHRHAMTQHLYIAPRSHAGVEGWHWQVLQLQGPFVAHNSIYSVHAQFSCFCLQRIGAVSSGLFHMLLNSTPLCRLL